MKQRPFNLSRGWKTARNFVLLAVALGLCLALLRAPLWLVEQTIRAEAAELGISKKEIEVLWAGDLPCIRLGGGGAPFPGMETVPAVLARGGGRLWFSYMGSYEGDVYLSGVRSLPDEGTPRLVALSALYDGVPTAQKNMDGLLVAVNLPEGIKKAEISVLPDGVRHTSNEQREQDVIWSPLIFGFDSLRGVDRMPYELLLQDGLGRTIDTAAGVLEREGDG